MLASLRKQVLNLGGKDIQGKGWKVAPSAAASSPSKSQKKAAGMLYISPDGKRFDTPQAVFKYLGAAGGITRAEAAAKSRAYKNDNPCPFTLKVRQGQLTVQHLGNLLMEKGPQDPTFHDESNLYPIGFEAHYADSETGTVFFNEVLDGIDEFNEDVPAFQVKIMREGQVEKTLVDKKPQGVWKKVKQYMEEHGTDQEKETAKSWSVIKLYYKFGLSNLEVRRRMEGLSGAIGCFKYKFVDEGSGDAGAEGKNKKAKTAKGAVAAGDAASGEDRDEKMRKKGKESGEGAEAEDGSEAFQKKAKKPPPPVTGYKLGYKRRELEVVKRARDEMLRDRARLDAVILQNHEAMREKDEVIRGKDAEIAHLRALAYGVEVMDVETSATRVVVEEAGAGAAPPRKRLRQAQAESARTMAAVQERLVAVKKEHAEEKAAVHSELRASVDAKVQAAVKETLAQVADALECACCLERLAPGAAVALECGHTYCNRAGCASSSVTVCPECRRPIGARVPLFGALASVCELLPREC